MRKLLALLVVGVMSACGPGQIVVAESIDESGEALTASRHQIELESEGYQKQRACCTANKDGSDQYTQYYPEKNGEYCTQTETICTPQICWTTTSGQYPRSRSHSGSMYKRVSIVPCE